MAKQDEKNVRLSEVSEQEEQNIKPRFDPIGDLIRW